jgi:hypothetical protein
VPFVYRGRYRDENIDSHEQDVTGQRARAFEWTERRGDFSGRSIWVESAWGDIIVVTSFGRSRLSEEELVAFAASVQHTEDAVWEAFVTEAAGGPGLHPDEGRTELARGQAGDLEWLLQNGPPIEGAGPAICREGDDLQTGLMRIELMDAAGHVTGCLGPGG